MNSRSHPEVAPIEMLLDWEGPAINDPAIGESNGTVEALVDQGTISGAVVWLTPNIASAVVGNSVYEALKDKIISFLAAWENQHGKRKRDELKQQLLEEIEKQYPDAQQAELLSQTVEQLFKHAGE